MNSELKLFNLELIKYVPCHKRKLIDLRFSCDGSNLFSLSFENEIKVFSLAKGTPEQTNVFKFTSDYLIQIENSHFDPNVFYSAGNDKVLRMYDSRTDTVASEVLLKLGVSRICSNKIDASKLFIASRGDDCLSVLDLSLVIKRE